MAVSSGLTQAVEAPARALGFAVDLPLDKIQAIRFCMALAESDYALHLPPYAEPLFRYIGNWFPGGYRFGVAGVPAISDCELSHPEPRCRIGTIERPLIFPHAVLDHCRRKWTADRPVRFSFCGLVTPERKRCLDAWARCSFPGRVGRGGLQLTPLRRVERLIARVTPVDRHALRLAEIGLCLYSSARGRQFPEKAWDETYYDLLASSQFVLCPNGDYVWSYRFFEAILCGAIPIVENSCGYYQGFTYRSLWEAAPELRWSAEVAEANFARAAALLTVPRDELNACIAARIR